MSAFVKRENANLMAVVGALFASVLCGFGPTLNNAKEWGIMFLWEISFNKWGSEALYSYSVKHYKHIYNVPQSASEFGYTIDREKLDLAVMFILGSAFRLIGFIGLTFLNRYRQK